MLKCREVTMLCSRELERPLGIRERVSLGVHLSMCSGCSNFRQQMKTMRRVMRAYADGRADSAAGDPPGGS